MFTSLILAATLTAAPSPGDTDPFQWLEKPRDPKALEWVRAQTKAAETELDAKPNYAELEQQLKTILAAQDPPPQISLLGPSIIGAVAAARRRPRIAVDSRWRRSR